MAAWARPVPRSWLSEARLLAEDQANNADKRNQKPILEMSRVEQEQYLDMLKEEFSPISMKEEDISLLLGVPEPSRHGIPVNQLVSGDEWMELDLTCILGGM